MVKKLLLALMLLMSIQMYSQDDAQRDSLSKVTLKCAQINSLEIVEMLPEYVSVRDSVIKKRTDVMLLLKKRQEYIIEKQTYVMNNGLNMSPELLQFYQEEIAELKYLFQTYEQLLNNEVNWYELNLITPLLEKVEGAVKIVAEREHIVYVFDETKKKPDALFPPLIYSSIDIMPSIKKELGLN